MKKRYDFMVVGAGISGATVSRVLAEAGKKVVVLDRRPHIGGNCFDRPDGHGILIHVYGPHIFHTVHGEVWDFLSRFTGWRRYEHRVKACIEGRLVSFPINLRTMRELYGLELSPEGMKEYLDGVKVALAEPSNSMEAVVSQVGVDLYEKFYKNYTLKQWGIPAEELDPSVSRRIPVRLTDDDRYFTDKYQGIPSGGYTGMFEKMLSHENISVALNADFSASGGGFGFDRLVYTGPVDEFFGFVHGRLGYRSLHFDFRTFETDSYQECAVVNYPNDHDYTRITEYKKLTGQRAENTTVSFEYPKAEGEPYYPVFTRENSEVFEKYSALMRREKKAVFLGRLGTYRYLNMDAACHEALRAAREMLRGRCLP